MAGDPNSDLFMRSLTDSRAFITCASATISNIFSSIGSKLGRSGTSFIAFARCRKRRYALVDFGFIIYLIGMRVNVE